MATVRKKPSKPPSAKPPKAKAVRKAGPSVPFRDRARAWTRLVLRGTLIGGALGGVVVGAGLYRHAEATVDRGLAGPVWSVPGHVWSGPVEVWPDLAYTPAELAEDLQAAGYARTAKAAQPGDFQVSADAVSVIGRAANGPGFTVKAGETLITFADGHVRSVTPQGHATFAPAALAIVRGPDNENRSPVPLAHIPKHLQQAVLAMEDARFYDHPGVDAVGIARALWTDLLARDMVQGGSTLTQQVAKNIFLSHDRTARRKFDEALLAVVLERRLSKDEILQLYLNEIYLGQSGGSAVCGMDAAARAYFGKPVERVTLGEAATLAGIISSPNPYSPVRHPEEARIRRDLALDRMLEMGFAEADAVAKAKKAALDVHASAGGRRAPWAVDLAVETVEGRVGDGAIAEQALEVYTTISPGLQRAAEAAVAEGMAELVKAHPELSEVQAALVAVRARDGAIVAIVGSRDYAASPYDRATFAERQIGSTIKGLTLLAALEKDPALSPATRFDDAALVRTHDGKDWTLTNYDHVFVGPISVRHAIAVSRNIPAILLAETVGMNDLSRQWKALGLSGATNYPSAALGGFGATPVELAGAYAVLSGGAWHKPWLTRGATTVDGAAVFDAPPAKATVRYSDRAVFLAGDVLRGVMREGTGKSAAKYGVGPGAAGKSGTTDGTVDAWFAGVSGPYAVAVWVGFDRDKPVGLTGSQAALPTWARFVAATGTSDTVPKAPPGVVQLDVCEDTDLPPCPDCTATRKEWFTEGMAPDPTCGIFPEARETVKDGWKKFGKMLGFGKDEPAPE